MERVGGSDFVSDLKQADSFCRVQNSGNGTFLVDVRMYESLIVLGPFKKVTSSQVTALVFTLA